MLAPDHITAILFSDRLPPTAFITGIWIRSLVRLDREPVTWQRATNELRIPPNTDYSLIRTGSSNAAHAPDRRTDEFGCQFVGRVRIVAGHRQEIAAP
jgi:hypothetical protein